jgi:hypothetical protein
VPFKAGGTSHFYRIPVLDCKGFFDRNNHIKGLMIFLHGDNMGTKQSAIELSIDEL